MANRVYLFGIDTTETHKKTNRSMIGLGEYNYDTPLLYQLLMSSNPELCQSSLFKTKKKVAILANAKGGLDNLRTFLSYLSAESLNTDIEKTLKWFSEPHNQYPYFLLEPVEIFDLVASDRTENQRMTDLLSEIQSLDQPRIKALAGFYEDKLVMSSWSNFLYYEPQGCVKPPLDKNKNNHSVTVDELLKYNDDFEGFDRLTDLKIYFSKDDLDLVSKILPEINRFPNLKSLWLSGPELVPEVSELNSIKKLILTNNQLTSLPEGIGSLSQLEELLLVSNKLTSLPESMKEMIGLKVLNLDRNQLQELPAWLSKLTSLENLNISANQLTTLPEEIGGLMKLREVNCFQNPLVDPSREMALIVSLPALEKLAFSGHDEVETKLQELPPELWLAKSLKSLFLSKMELGKIPNDIAKLTSLSALGFTECGVESISDELWSLTLIHTLMMGNNPIGSIPDDIKNFTDLKLLNVSNCGLQSLPDAFMNLNHLENFQASNNNINGLPKSLMTLKKRATFNLFNNPVYDKV